MGIWIRTQDRERLLEIIGVQAFNKYVQVIETAGKVTAVRSI